MSYLDNIVTSVTGTALNRTASNLGDLTASVAENVETLLADGVATIPGVSPSLAGAIGTSVGRIGGDILDAEIGKGLTKLINKVGGPDAMYNRTEQLLVGEAAKLIGNQVNVVLSDVGASLSSSISGGNLFSTNKSPQDKITSAGQRAVAGGLQRDATATMSGAEQITRNISGNASVAGLVPTSISKLASTSADALKTGGSGALSKLTGDIQATAGKVPGKGLQSPGAVIKNAREVEAASSLILKFPSDMDNLQAYIGLHLQDYVRPDPVTSNTSIKTKESIYLPLPENLMEAFSLRYDSQDMQEWGDAIAGGGIKNMTDTIRDSIEKGQVGIEDVQSFVNSGASIAGSVLGRRAYQQFQSAAPGVAGVIESQFGAVPNPHPSIFFKGMSLRTHQMQWKLSPKSEFESKVIRDITKTMKKNFLPKASNIGTLSTLQYPSMVFPKIYGPAIEYFTIEYKTCMVSQFNITYTPDGSSAFFHNGAPVAMMLSMELQEIEYFTGDHYDDQE